MQQWLQEGGGEGFVVMWQSDTLAGWETSGKGRKLESVNMNATMDRNNVVAF